MIAGIQKDPVGAENFHPCWSGGVVVFVEDVAESVSSSDVEVFECVWVGDGLR
jgi:hypothetical protein